MSSDSDYPDEQNDVTDDGILKVYEVGKLTVLGFGGKDVPTDFSTAAYRDAILRLIAEHDVETLAFDLTGVQLVPSGMLGVFASLFKSGVKVEIYNPSKDVRDVLAITKLDELLTVRDVEI